MKIAEKAEKLKGYVDRLLKYLRVNDEKGLVSLTNIAMMLVLYKLATTPALGIQDLTALFIAVMGYQGKRFLEKPKNRR